MTPTRDPKRHLKFAVLATDIALFTLYEGQLRIRIIPVHRPPYFRHRRGLPGGLIHPNETAEKAASRTIRQKGDIRFDMHLEQLYTFSALNRDPRGRVVAVAYLGLVPWDALSSSEREASDESSWEPVIAIKNLAYDHDKVLKVALERLKSRVTYTTLINRLMPTEFTLTELEQAYEAILGTDLDKRNFRKKIFKLGIIKALGRKRRGAKARPAELYAFKHKKVLDIEVL